MYGAAARSVAPNTANQFSWKIAFFAESIIVYFTFETNHGTKKHMLGWEPPHSDFLLRLLLSTAFSPVSFGAQRSRRQVSLLPLSLLLTMVHPSLQMERTPDEVFLQCSQLATRLLGCLVNELLSLGTVVPIVLNPQKHINQIVLRIRRQEAAPDALR